MGSIDTVKTNPLSNELDNTKERNFNVFFEVQDVGVETFVDSWSAGFYRLATLNPLGISITSINGSIDLLQAAGRWPFEHLLRIFLKNQAHFILFGDFIILQIFSWIAHRDFLEALHFVENLIVFKFISIIGSDEFDEITDVDQNKEPKNDGEEKS